MATDSGERFEGETPQLALDARDTLLGAPRSRVGRARGRRSPSGPEVQREGVDAYKRIGQEVSDVIAERRESAVAVRLDGLAGPRRSGRREPMKRPPWVCSTSGQRFEAGGRILW